jgi:NADH-quinone oxidoreductase subunit C
MDSTAIIDALSRAIPGEASRYEAVTSRDGMPTIYVTAEHLVETCQVLRDDPGLRFVLLLDVVGMDYLPRTPRFEVVYILACPGASGFGTTPKRLRLKVRVGEEARVPSVSGVWPSANWSERELFEGHPMRRDYPVQIKMPVKTYEPLQLSEEEFVANLEAARNRSRQG